MGQPGRPFGSRDSYQRVRRRKVVLEAVRGEDPLSHLLAVMNDPTASTARRDRAAIAAAGYVHPKARPVPGMAIPENEKWERLLRLSPVPEELLRLPRLPWETDGEDD
jgi:hypothetical protein